MIAQTLATAAVFYFWLMFLGPVVTYALAMGMIIGAWTLYCSLNDEAPLLTE